MPRTRWSKPSSPDSPSSAAHSRRTGSASTVAQTPLATKWSKSAIGPAPTATRSPTNPHPHHNFSTPTAQPTSPRPPPRDAFGSRHRVAGPGRHTPPPRPPGACPGSGALWLVGRLRCADSRCRTCDSRAIGAPIAAETGRQEGPESSGSPRRFRRSVHCLVGLVNQ